MQPNLIEPVTPVKSVEHELLHDLVATIGQRRYNHWFHQKTAFRVIDDLLVVSVANNFLMTWLQRKFNAVLMQCGRRILGDRMQLQFELLEELESGTNPVSDPLPEHIDSDRKKNSGSFTPGVALASNPDTTKTQTVESGPIETQTGLSFSRLLEVQAETLARTQELPLSKQQTASGQRSRRYLSLNDFQEAPENILALTAVHQVCQQPGSNPLYLHSAPGLGKTHLLEGIALELRNRFPSLQVVHVTAESFTNFFTVALRQHSLPSFRQKFRNADVLLIDDIDFLDAKRGIQEELLHTLKHLEAHGRQVVLTSDRHPRLLTRISDELKTRFLSGMVCRLDTPNEDARRRILDRKAARLTGQFSPEALNFIAQKFRNNIRELEGALRTLQTYYCMTGKRVGITAARQLLADLERDCIKVVKLSDIERVVCDLFGLMQEELRSDKRIRSVSHPRMLAMYLARKHTRAAYSEIGAYFGGRNHSTVITAEKKICNLLNDKYQMRVATQHWSVSDVIDNIEQQLSNAG